MQDSLTNLRDELRRKVMTFAMAGHHKARAKAEAELRAVIVAILRRGQHARGQG